MSSASCETSCFEASCDPRPASCCWPECSPAVGAGTMDRARSSPTTSRCHSGGGRGARESRLPGRGARRVVRHAERPRSGVSRRRRRAINASRRSSTSTARAATARSCSSLRRGSPRAGPSPSRSRRLPPWRHRHRRVGSRACVASAISRSPTSSRCGGRSTCSPSGRTSTRIGSAWSATAPARAPAQSSRASSRAWTRSS